MCSDGTLAFCTSAEFQILSVLRGEWAWGYSPALLPALSRYKSSCCGCGSLDGPSPELPGGQISAGCDTLSRIHEMGGRNYPWCLKLVLGLPSAWHPGFWWNRDAGCCSSALSWCFPFHPCTACSLQQHLPELYALREECSWFACKKPTLMQSALRSEKRRLGWHEHHRPGKLQQGCSVRLVPQPCWALPHCCSSMPAWCSRQLMGRRGQS